MAVIVKKACEPTKEVASYARKVGATLDGKRNLGRQLSRIYDGFIIRVRNILGNAVVTILEPPGLWVYGATIARQYYTGYDWERSAPIADHSLGALREGKNILSPTDKIQTEADIKTLIPDDLIFFPRRRSYRLGEKKDAQYAWNSAFIENGGVYTLPITGVVSDPSPSSDYDREGAVLIELTAPLSTNAHWSLTESDITKNFSNAWINQQRIYIAQEALASVTDKENPCLFTNTGFVKAYDTAFAACIREIEPEIHDGEELPLRYRDIVVVIPYVDSKRPALFENVYEDTGIKQLPFLHGVSVFRANLPYDYANEVGYQPLEPTWFRDISMLDSEVLDVVPAIYNMWVAEQDGQYYETPDGLPAPPPDPSYPLYFEGREHHFILSMSYAVREPPLGIPPTTPLPLPPGAIPVDYTPAQLLIVQTTVTAVFDPANGETRGDYNLGPNGDPAYVLPGGTPATEYAYVSTRAYTVDLATGSYEETEIEGTKFRADGYLLPPPEEGPPDDPGVIFPVYYTYAAVKGAVPCVRVEVNTDVLLASDFGWDPDAEFEELLNFEGQEVPESTKFVLVYPGGNTTTFNLPNWCPVRPVMRGMLWGDYISLMRITYDHNNSEIVTKTIVPSEYNSKAFFYDSDPTADPPTYMTWLDQGLLRRRTMRRFVDPTRTPVQRIAASIGNGKIAILCCPMEQQRTAVKLDWHLIIAYEESGVFIEDRGVIFEQLPLESSSWLSMTVQKEEIMDLATDTITQEAVLVVSMQTPRSAHPFQQVDGYYEETDNTSMHLYQTRDLTFPRTELDIAEYDTDASSEQKISTDGGRTWRVLIRNMPGDAYYMGNAFSPRVPESKV